MGKLKQFLIVLADDRSVYMAGDTVSGQVIIDLNSSMEMSAVKLKCTGKAHVHWSEGSNKNRRHYSATEILFEHHIALEGEGAVSNDRRELSQGQHTYQFSFQLPATLPTSVEDHVGYIRYYIKSTIVKPWKFDHNTKKILTVLDVLDLNTRPDMLNPSGCQESKHLCCLCCASGPIEVECHLDRTGYVPGEWAIINATVTNTSNSNVEKTSADVMQTVSYHSTSKTKVVSRSAGQIFGPGCAPHSTTKWTNERIQIPPLPPSESAHCRIIDIAYSIQFQAHLRTCAVNLRAYAPITIGTIPLRSLQMYSNLPPEYPSVPSAPTPDSSATQPPSYSKVTSPSGFSTMPPPPTYAVATYGGVNVMDDEDNDYTMGDRTYTPQYTYYDWNESAFTYSGNS